MLVHSQPSAGFALKSIKFTTTNSWLNVNLPYCVKRLTKAASVTTTNTFYLCQHNIYIVVVVVIVIVIQVTLWKLQNCSELGNCVNEKLQLMKINYFPLLNNSSLALSNCTQLAVYLCNGSCAQHCSVIFMHPRFAYLLDINLVLVGSSGARQVPLKIFTYLFISPRCSARFLSAVLKSKRINSTRYMLCNSLDKYLHPHLNCEERTLELYGAYKWLLK